MPISIILDVATGLVFLFFLLALIASSIQELIAGIFAWRGTYLAKAIDVILDNEKSATFAWSGIADFVKAHLSPGRGETALQRMDRQAGPTTTPGEAVLRKVLSIQTHPLLSSNPSTMPSYIPARNLALALMEILRNGSQDASITAIGKTVDLLPPGDLKQILTLFLTHAGQDIDAFRTRLEEWFDDSMARLSGIYTRLSHYMMLSLGVVLALALNVDSLHIARSLWDTPAMRAAAIASASNANTFHDAVAMVAASDPPTAAATTSAAAPAGGSGLSEEIPQLKAAWQAVQGLEDDQLPLGWGARSSVTVWSVLDALPGWLITAAAIGFGAPFWFGLLQNLTNMRSAGPRPNP